jgi:glycosyltransferase involved in cell wall biosynthesis
VICGMLRIRNEARWIERVLKSIIPLCERVVILDDHSTDNTTEICRSFPEVSLFPSPFKGLDEVRDKNYLLHKVADVRPQWVLHIDGDEELEPNGQEIIRRTVEAAEHQFYRLPVIYLWDSPDQMRVDGVYGNYKRASLFRPVNGSRFESPGKAGFHCGNVPAPIVGAAGICKARLLHYGYLNRSDRVKKYEWYNETDPKNSREDRYRHIVIGDVFPPESEFKHAGPLRLAPVF